MSATNTDYFKKSRRKFSTTVGTGGITGIGTTLPLASTLNLDTDTAVVVVVEPGTAFEEVIVGIVSSNSLISCLRGLETTSAQAHAEGAVVTMYFTETHWDSLIDGILVEHKQTGGHSSITADSLVVGGINFSNVVPAGVISEYAGSSAPSGYLMCDGSSVLRSTYSTLFSAIGTAYGAVDGTHFNLPNRKGRVGVGLDSSQTEFDALGETGGAKTHTLTTPEIPSHYHVVSTRLNGGFTSGAPDVIMMYGTGGAGANQEQGTQSTGGGIAHNNLQPYITLNYIIKT